MGDLSPEIWSAVRLSIELAALATLILLLVGTPIAWWLARSRAWWKEAVATVVALPLVLPPTVLGFYLLVVLGPNGPGGLLASTWGGETLAFTFGGLVIGSVVYLVLEELLSQVTEYWAIIMGPLLLLIVLFGRGGIMGLIGRLSRG